MTDPYSVLGVSPNSSDEEIKQAYRKLAKQYHPDAYKDNPLASLAEEKMKEINEAYDTIQKMRAGGANYSNYSSYANQNRQGYAGRNAEVYARVRSCINTRNIMGAQTLLDGVTERDAEWYFLMGSVNYAKGWMDEAYTNFQTAVNMNPGNPEYQNALRRMNARTGAYRTARSTSVSGCDICGNLLCADCLCECLGGDLIPCC
ncbi:MAG: J domain-containing protein [Clostridia bacterium]|nr:J domain-containing protein [Clostridia bacterium]